jgi:DNA polymerase III delta prime subunit
MEQTGERKLMSRPRPSIYRDALQVSPERIAAMNDEDLNVLMGQLLRAQAYKCGSPSNKIRVNTEGKAQDDGCDGWSAKPVTPDDWLGSTNTCWQFKAGSAGEPRRLDGEASKRIPKETLISGGRFVVVASGSTNGKKGEDDRLAKLAADASAAGIPTEQIEVIGSERLTNWCNQHPAVAACWAGRPDGLWSLDDWSNSDEHQVPWHASAAVQSELDAGRADLDFVVGSVYHLHIQGPPGVGKTRFALELCREAAWRYAVIYIRQAADLRLAELIDGAAADNGVQLTVVADEVQPEMLRPLRDSVGRGNGRIRLITVGHSPSPDLTRIPARLVKPLDPEAMRKVIKGWYPAMPPEHIDFVVRFAGGYVRLGRLAADAIVRDSSLDVTGLLSRDEIRGFLDGMLGMGDRRALYVVAVLNRVGWTDDKQNEAEVIAQHFGLDWNWVRATVDGFHRRLGIVPRGGRYRYISPTPLGIHLAVEAWTTYPDLLPKLPDVLPSEEARDAYYDRLQSMASNPQAREYAREELKFFFRVDDFMDARRVRRWSALSSADPDVAARNILTALSDASLEDRRRIEDRARREAVGALVGLAWRSSSFHDAVKALALLAEAENETWANNASAEFVARFQIFLSGTAVPYNDRLSVLDELLAEERPSLASLVVKSLAQAGNQHAIRMSSNPAADELPEKEWQPSTEAKYFECVEAAVARLSAIAKRGVTGVQADLVAAAENLSMMLRESTVQKPVAGFFDAVREAYPVTREPLRRIIADIIHRERQYWRKLSPQEIEVLEALQARFEDPSLGARLQQYVGQELWDQEEQPDVQPLAEELLSTPEVLAEYWPWLTSGDASGAWRLGEALAAVDLNGELSEKLPSLPGAGRDLRLLCGYVSARRRTLGNEWYDRWVDSQFERDPKPIALLFEVAWRCGATESVASIVVTLLRTESVSPEIVGQLGFGRWGENLAVNVLETVLRAMTETGHSETAIGILHHRMKVNPSEASRWIPLALQLVTSTELIRSKHMTNYHWKEVTNAIVADHPKEIAAAILREQADRESGVWFAEYSDAKDVLLACVEQDPSGVWSVMQSYLSSPTGAYMLSIGFPRGVLERMPADEVWAWIQEQPDGRAEMVARLTSKDMSTDETLTSRIVGMYGDNEQVASAFFSEYVSGTWSGPVSVRWDQLADSLQEVSERTALPKLRRWALDSVRSLRRMAERDRQREEEEDLG